ncbi:DNA adenine methylase [Microbacterium betulae]|uniref:DNA adenine methylase n=1 Tax=Microbacterium betulae TaxID=2981139 RepID=A0AA97I7N1_9MICO|nr:DNA adenine methylase [Microbacterium sp. AB]WOF23807.1 DNA adenine methylase [Microbacterium sp. AB]
MSVLKPPIAYFGGKTSLAERIVALMPEHDGYIEPFAGSLSVLLAKPKPAGIEVVNDIDGRLMTFWRVLRDRPLDLARAAALTPHSRAELEQAMQLRTDLDELETARQVWVLLTQGRSRTLNRTGWRFFADPAGRNTGASYAMYMDAYRGRIIPAAERIAAVSLENRDALDVIAQYGQHARNLLYVDPPYLSSTRQGGRYAHEMSAAVDHERLLDALLDCRAAVMLSGYAADLYDRALTGWDRVELAGFTGNAVQKDRVEVLWINRARAGVLDLWGGDAA